MRRIAVLSLVLALVVVLTTPAMADTVAAMKAAPPDAATRDYTFEGDIVTIWEDSFLFNDSTGQVVVDIRPHTTSELKLAGRDYVLISGHMDGAVFKPMVISKADGTSVTFNGTAALPPLSPETVTRNTERYRFTPPEMLNPDIGKPAAQP